MRGHSSHFAEHWPALPDCIPKKHVHTRNPRLHLCLHGLACILKENILEFLHIFCMHLKCISTCTYLGFLVTASDFHTWGLSKKSTNYLTKRTHYTNKENPLKSTTITFCSFIPILWNKLLHHYCRQRACLVTNLEWNRQQPCLL